MCKSQYILISRAFSFTARQHFEFMQILRGFFEIAHIRTLHGFYVDFIDLEFHNTHFFWNQKLHDLRLYFDLNSHLKI